MPRSSSSLAAFSISGMSFLEPMTTPTRGASTSMPSNSASTWVIVSGAEGCCSLMRSRSSGSHTLDGAAGDVASQLLPLEGDHVGGSIRGLPGGAGVLAERGDVEHPSPRGHDLAVAKRGARVRDLDLGGDVLEASDRVPL